MLCTLPFPPVCWCRDGPFLEFQEAMKAVVEHHFNNHEFCSAWCPAKKWAGEEKVRKELRYRCKIKDRELYEQFTEIHETLSPALVGSKTCGMTCTATSVRVSMDSSRSFSPKKNISVARSQIRRELTLRSQSTLLATSPRTPIFSHHLAWSILLLPLLTWCTKIT